MSVLGLCSLLQCPLRLEPVCKLAPQIVPAVIGQLMELIDAYKGGKCFICTGQEVSCDFGRLCTCDLTSPAGPATAFGGVVR